MELEIIVMGLLKLRYEVDEMKDLDLSAALISTSMPERAACSGKFARSLVLNYDDVISPADSSAFTPALARKASEFVLSLGEEITNLYVACDFGTSRSAAIAAAIMRHLGYEELSIWANPSYHPNPLVYSLMSCALGVPVREDEIEELRRINEQAFGDAVN